jgi:hypothetical protein
LLFFFAHREIPHALAAPEMPFIRSDCNGPKLVGVQRCSAMLTASVAAAYQLKSTGDIQPDVSPSKE